MLNALDNLPEDPVELRRVTELLASEVKAQALMIEKLQHQLHGANRHRFGSKSEGMDQLRLFAENEESTGLGRLAARGVVARIGCQVLTQAFATTTDMLNAA